LVEKEPLRVAIIGTGKRSSYMYGPLLKALSDDVQLVSVWGLETDSARELGIQLRVPWYTNFDQLIRETAPQLGIICVNFYANGEVGLMAVEHGLHILTETPIAHKLSEADAIISAAHQRGLKIEISEQFHRRPLEQIKLKLINNGVFGKIYCSFNDFSGHGYHGVSVLRSYLGFDAKPMQVVGSVRKFELDAHWSRLRNSRDERVETQEHGLIEFDGGQIGVYHWSDMAYDSALRWWRSSRFLGKKGMGISVGVGLEVKEYLSVIAPGGEAPQFITIERRWERVDGGALVAIVAHTGDPNFPIVKWENPFCPKIQGHGVQWHDDEIGVAGCVMSLVNAVRNNSEPTYGPLQGRLDQEIILALRQSSVEGGKPIKLPLDSV